MKSEILNNLPRSLEAELKIWIISEAPQNIKRHWTWHWIINPSWNFWWCVKTTVIRTEKSYKNHPWSAHLVIHAVANQQKSAISRKSSIKSGFILSKFLHLKTKLAPDHLTNRKAKLRKGFLIGQALDLLICGTGKALHASASATWSFVCPLQWVKYDEICIIQWKYKL